MKTWFQNHKSSLAVLPVSHRIQIKRVMRWISVVLVFAIINLTIGCRNYFKVTTSNQPSSETIAGMNVGQKSVIVHFNQKKWLLTDIQLKDNKVTGVLNDYQMPPTIKTVRPTKPNRYLTRASHNQRYLLNEVHLYLDEFAKLGDDKVSIPVSSISKIEIYDKDTATTVGSYVLSVLGITASAYLLLGIIILLTKESCPFIY